MTRTRPRATRVAAALLACGLLAAGCSRGADDRGSSVPSPSPSTSVDHGSHEDTAAQPARSRPLRAGERIVRVAMPKPYTPSAPYGAGTDDYRCFVLDPHLAEDSFITGLNILPGTRKVVHHVILFRLPPGSEAAAEQMDESDPGEGWTCFGGTGLENEEAVQDAPWLGAWAPGGKEQVMARDVGVPMQAGSKVIMQVHYNLLAGPKPDVTSAQLRLAPGTKDLAALQTVLLPAPVELPCRPGHDQNRLCDRDAAVEDAETRFGPAGQAANYLHFLCGRLHPGPVQTCDQKVRRPETVRAVAGHMHLLGRSIKIQVNPGTDRARTVLDIPTWDFDNQGAKPVDPVRLEPGDTVRVTCHHDQHLRDLLPAFRNQPERYVVWGEGTTDEMCLGILLVTRP
ncbi:MAG: hypothetical protein HOQ22_01440 [Nocardioidaceae bacterium]|nr:hypothetical protein [Nocardioidaceae bacterium]NUS49690.1 hypothetical protein [Nocardioidaceae bacterium]